MPSIYNYILSDTFRIAQFLRKGYSFPCFSNMIGLLSEVLPVYIVHHWSVCCVMLPDATVVFFPKDRLVTGPATG